MVGGGGMDLDLFLEIGDAVVVGDSELEVIVGWDCVGGVKWRLDGSGDENSV